MYMAITGRMKLSEARVLVFIENAENRHKYCRYMSSKLNMDYNYLLNIVKAMQEKNWIKKHKLDRKVFYELAAKADLELAKTVIMVGR